MLVEIPNENQVINLQYVESMCEIVASDSIKQNYLSIHMRSGDMIVLHGWTIQKWNSFMSRVITRGGRMQ